MLEARAGAGVTHDRSHMAIFSEGIILAEREARGEFLGGQHEKTLLLGLQAPPQAQILMPKPGS